MDTRVPKGAGTSHETQSLALGYVFAAAGAILFSIKAVIVKLAYDFKVDAETLLALRLGLSLPFYLAVGFWTVQIGRAHV